MAASVLRTGVFNPAGQHLGAEIAEAAPLFAGPGAQLRGELGRNADADAIGTTSTPEWRGGVRHLDVGSSLWSTAFVDRLWVGFIRCLELMLQAFQPVLQLLQAFGQQGVGLAGLL